VCDHLWCRRATGDAQVDGKDGVDWADNGVRRAEHVAAEGAVADRRDAAGLGHRGVGDEERLVHAAGYRAGDEQDVGVPGGGDDAEAKALQVVVRAREQRQLVLAPVA